MATVINLRQARKRKVRDRARDAAHENALRHGVKKTTRDLLDAEKKRDERLLDGHLRDRDNSGSRDEP